LRVFALSRRAFSSFSPRNFSTMSKKVMGTHSGSFHCDEALACYMLRILPEYKDAELVRSRDKEVLAKCDILVDVGAVYDPTTHRYDHHQKGFFETFSEKFPTKLSSAGLVYKHFGKDIIRQLVKRGEDDIEIIFQKIYKDFIEALDAIDNGISQYPDDVEAAYCVNTDLSSRVGKLNPRWNEDGKDILERFQKAMEMAGSEFVSAVQYLDKGWLPARDIVKEALSKRQDIYASGEVVKLEGHTVWKKHLLELEVEEKVNPTVKYVLYPDTSGNWRVQCVPISDGSFISRLSLPKDWCGVRDEALSAVTGVEGCIFIHANGFIGGAKTYESALKLATMSLEMDAKAKEEAASKKQKVDA